MNVAPDTWVTRTALRRGQRLWNKMIKEATEAAPGLVKAKYTDYKVYLNNSIPPGEWNYSEYHSEDIDWADPNLLTDPHGS